MRVVEQGFGRDAADVEASSAESTALLDTRNLSYKLAGKLHLRD